MNNVMLNSPTLSEAEGFQHLSSRFRSRNTRLQSPEATADGGQEFGMTQERIVWLVGIATFFFGFGAGALLNIYLIMIKSPLVMNFRSSLNFISSIIGDGIILPVVNMLIASFIIKNSALISKINVILGIFFGFLITIYFYVMQAVNGLVNWSMPKPWQWNFLGIWHFFYMFAVASLISFYCFILIQKIKKEKTIPKSALVVIGGIILFLILLKLDYLDVNLIK